MMRAQPLSFEHAEVYQLVYSSDRFRCLELLICRPAFFGCGEFSAYCSWGFYFSDVCGSSQYETKWFVKVSGLDNVGTCKNNALSLFSNMQSSRTRLLCTFLLRVLRLVLEETEFIVLSYLFLIDSLLFSSSVPVAMSSGASTPCGSGVSRYPRVYLDVYLHDYKNFLSKRHFNAMRKRLKLPTMDLIATRRLVRVYAVELTGADTARFFGVTPFDMSTCSLYVAKKITGMWSG